MNADGRVQALGRLPGAEADAGDMLIRPACTGQRNLDAIACYAVAVREVTSDAQLDPFQRAVHVACSAADGTGLSQNVPGLDGTAQFQADAAVIDVTEPAAIDHMPPVDATLADDVGRPVAVCGHCGSFGQRDLLDRFSRTEYYSCDDCGHMWQQPADD